MLGMHQMVDCVNCMFGYCVLVGCLATRGARNGVIKESCWFGERLGRQGRSLPGVIRRIKSSRGK